MPRMNRGERISERLDSRLLQYHVQAHNIDIVIEDYNKTDSPARLVQYCKYLSENTVFKNSPISYNQLSDYCEHEQKDLNYILKLDCCEVKKDTRAERICKVLQSAKTEDIVKVSNLVNELTDLSWFSKEMLNLSPTEKMHELIKRNIPRWKRRNIDYLPKSALHAWTDQHKGTKVDTEDLPLVASYFNISPHYLFGVSPKVGYYSSVPAVEEIIDRFLFVPERMKDEITLAVERGV